MEVLLLGVSPVAGGNQAARGSMRKVFEELLLRKVVGLVCVIQAPHPLPTCSVAHSTHS